MQHWIFNLNSECRIRVLENLETQCSQFKCFLCAVVVFWGFFFFLLLSSPCFACTLLIGQINYLQLFEQKSKFDIFGIFPLHKLNTAIFEVLCFLSSFVVWLETKIHLMITVTNMSFVLSVVLIWCVEKWLFKLFVQTSKIYVQ